MKKEFPNWSYPFKPIILDPTKPFVFPQKFTEEIKFEREKKSEPEIPPTPTPFIPVREPEQIATPKEIPLTIEEDSSKIDVEPIFMEIQEPEIIELIEPEKGKMSLEEEIPKEELPLDISPLEEMLLIAPTPTNTPKSRHRISITEAIKTYFHKYNHLLLTDNQIFPRLLLLC